MAVRKATRKAGKGTMRSVKAHSRKGGSVKSYTKRLKSGIRLRVRASTRTTMRVAKTTRRRKGAGVKKLNHNYRVSYATKSR